MKNKLINATPSKLSLRRTAEPLNLTKKKTVEKYISFRINEDDIDRLEQLLYVVNEGRIRKINRSQLIKTMIRIASSKSSLIRLIKDLN